MTVPFTLKLDDNQSVPVDFINHLNYKVEDGGFDITTPRRSAMSMQQLGAGLFRPVRQTERGYREATIRFSIHGADRSEIAQKKQVIVRMLKDLKPSLYASGKRCQLQYAWDGQTYITYFEVYGGYIDEPEGILSVDKLHVTDREGKYYVPGFKLVLYISAVGYGVSLFSDPVGIYTSSYYTSRTTSPVTVHNGFLEWVDPAMVTKYNWVNIDGADVIGDSPMPLKIQIENDDTDVQWNALHVGHTISPFPTQEDLIFAMNDRKSSANISPTNTPSASSCNNNYTDISINAGIAGRIVWEGRDLSGVFLPILYGYWLNNLNANMSFSFGVWDATGTSPTGNRTIYQPFMVGGGVWSETALCSVLRHPPYDPSVFDLGGNFEILDHALFLYNGDTSTQTTKLEYVFTLPIDQGIRTYMLVDKTSGTNTPYNKGILTDDAWKRYPVYLTREDTGYKVVNSYALHRPLSLLPGIDQRLYFQISSSDGSYEEPTNGLKVQIFGAPSFETLAY